MVGAVNRPYSTGAQASMTLCRQCLAVTTKHHPCSLGVQALTTLRLESTGTTQIPCLRAPGMEIMT